ncbi:MAG TPA: hypothetical protein VET26_02840, partial [Candidatus Sulfotelmatobacter sp.]|nr:hypothetical protein [Candidatus Sulfotelmatobacter sp.]
MNLRRTAVRIGIMVSGAAALAAPLGSGTIPIQAAAADPSGIQGPFRAAPAGAVSTDLSQANATV